MEYENMTNEELLRLPKSEQIFEVLVSKNKGLFYTIVYRDIKPKGFESVMIDEDDLYSLYLLALHKSYKTYEEGVSKFVTYASACFLSSYRKEAIHFGAKKRTPDKQIRSLNSVGSYCDGKRPEFENVTKKSYIDISGSFRRLFEEEIGSYKADKRAILMDYYYNETSLSMEELGKKHNFSRRTIFETVKSLEKTIRNRIINETIII